MQDRKHINFLSSVAILAILSVGMIQCKTFDRGALKGTDSEWTIRKQEFTAPFSKATHFAGKNFFGNMCAKEAFPYIFGNEPTTTWGPGLNWWAASQNDLVTVDSKTDQYFVKQYQVAITLEISCPYAFDPNDVLPGCEGGKEWHKYRTLMFALETEKYPLLARNFIILAKKNYFVSEPYNAEKPCETSPMNATALEQCLQTSTNLSATGDTCKDRGFIPYISKNPQLSALPFSPFTANSFFRTLIFKTWDNFPYVGSLTDDPYMMPVRLTKMEQAFPLDLVIPTDLDLGRVTKLAFFDPAYLKEVETNPPVPLARYMQHDGEKIVNEISTHIRASNLIRIQKLVLIPTGEKAVTRNSYDEPAQYDTYN